MGLRLLIHAPTAEALARARSNAANFLRAEPAAEVEIVVNAGAVEAAVATLGAAPDTDRLIVFCGNTLARSGVDPGPGARSVDAAVAHIARRQADGWAYMRA